MYEQYTLKSIKYQVFYILRREKKKKLLIDIDILYTYKFDIYFIYLRKELLHRILLYKTGYFSDLVHHLAQIQRIGIAKFMATKEIWNIT